MLQAGTSNPIPGDGFSRTTKDSMIRKFLEGNSQLWAGKQKEGKRSKRKNIGWFHVTVAPFAEWAATYLAYGVIEGTPSPWGAHQPVTVGQEGVHTTGATHLGNKLHPTRPILKCMWLFLFD